MLCFRGSSDVMNLIVWELLTHFCFVRYHFLPYVTMMMITHQRSYCTKQHDPVRALSVVLVEGGEEGVSQHVACFFDDQTMMITATVKLDLSSSSFLREVTMKVVYCC